MRVSVVVSPTKTLVEGKQNKQYLGHFNLDLSGTYVYPLMDHSLVLVKELV